MNYLKVIEWVVKVVVYILKLGLKDNGCFLSVSGFED